VGWYSLSSVYTNSFNTAVGAGTLVLNNADSNTAVGTAAMSLNTSGFENVAVGTDALLYNASGNYNNAVGVFALFYNFDGSFNNAFGNEALSQNVHASDNTAIGDLALANNDVTRRNLAYFNTAVGAQSLYSNTDGNSNTAIGWQALYFNDAGNFNTANGGFALLGNTDGDGNTATGYGALSQFPYNGSFNTAIGNNAGNNVVSASNVICIGANVAGADTSNSCFIGSIRGVTTIHNDAMPVLIDSAGQLGTASSSRRYKTDIKPIDKASESILALKPVSFRYKVHKDATPHFGLIAEEVAEVNPGLVIYDADGKPCTVRYEAVNAMLLNEFLKEHRKNEKQEATITQLKSAVAKQEMTAAQQQKQMEALTAGLQKVSAQLEVIKPAPQTVLNRQQ